MAAATPACLHARFIAQMNNRMKHIYNILTVMLAVIVSSCSSESEILQPQEWSLDAKIRNMQGMTPSATKVSYSTSSNVNQEFEVGDCFGLFVLDGKDAIVENNLKVYCSGLDNSGKGVFSIFKSEPGEGNSSNISLSEILGSGTRFYAYFPYNESLAVTDVPGLMSIVQNSCSSLPKDQTSSITDHDLLVASNIPECEYGEVSVKGKIVRLSFEHVFSMLRFGIPSGSSKYEYRFDGYDFSPYLIGTEGDTDHYGYVFKPGCVLDITIKYLHGGKLYKLETGNRKNIWPVTTLAGHCYYLDENAPVVPYSEAVDMGTSVMWCSFNIGAETDPSATIDNIGGLVGAYLMWGVNQVTATVGSGPYTNYNNAFTEGTKPKDLPAGYDYSGDRRYDAATNLWGGKWRTPTYPEWEELFAVCTTSKNGKTITFTSKITGKSIILPYGGYSNGSIPDKSVCYYWSSTSTPGKTGKAKSVYLSSASPSLNDNADRYTGIPLRAVYSKD